MYFPTESLKTLQLDGDIIVVQHHTHSRKRENIPDKHSHRPSIAHVPSLDVHIDSAGEQVGEQEEREAIAVESVQDLAGGVGNAALLRHLALGEVEFGEHEHFDDAEDQQLREIEAAHPADVGAVGHAAGDEEVGAVVPQGPDAEDEPDEGPFEEVDHGHFGQGAEGLESLFGLPVFLFLFLLLRRADDGGQPGGVFVALFFGGFGGLELVFGGLFVARQDALAGSHAGEEDGEVADEGVDALAVLR